MSDPIRVLQYGLGPIGRAMARHVASRENLVLVGAVEIDPAKVGADLGTVIDLPEPLEIPVSGSLEEALAHASADAVLHTTQSYFPSFSPQILEILDAGLDVVSTSEELSFPWLSHPAEAGAIHAAAVRAGKTVLGTGVNPGFLMDTLPLALTALCQRVDRIEVTREMNASLRRGPFQMKIGSGLTVEAFEERMAQGRMGHVGLPESAGMIFDTLGKTLARFQTTVEPVVAGREIRTDHVTVSPGQVCGLKQIARADSPDGPFLTLTFIAALDHGTNEDTLRITGVPTLEVTLRGTNGDLATIAIAVNALFRVHGARPGLVTMRDLPLVARI
jgi:2,4-diaminopentanoate dehydrogenase